MPTPIHVRGKRTAVDPVTPHAAQHSPKRIHRRRHREEAALKKYQPHLHDLPAEILQDIFCYGTNLRLPLVCSRLYHTLTAHSIRKRLVYRLFSIQDGFEIWAADDRHVSMRNQYCVEDDREMARYQSAVLRQRWFTYDFVRECQWQHLMRHARREVRRHLPQASTASVGAHMAELERRARVHFDWGAFSESIVLTEAGFPDPNQRQGNRAPIYTIDREDGAAVHVSLPDGFGLNAQLVIQSPGASESTAWLTRYTFPAFQAQCRVPRKLQYGPWTQDKGNFLTMVAFGIGAAGGAPQLREFVPSKSRHAPDGLADAIREDCLPYLRFFFASTEEDYDEAMHNLLMCTYVQDPTRPDLDMVEICRESGIVVDPGDPQARLDATGPWRVVNEPDAAAFPVFERDAVELRHLRAVLYEAPVGLRAEQLFCELVRDVCDGAEDEDGFKEVGALVIYAKIYVEDRARVAMIEAIEQQLNELRGKDNPF